MNSTAAHEIDDGLKGFIERFIRYGRGLRLLDVYYDNPGMFVPQRSRWLNNPAPANSYLADVQHHSMWWGYLAEKSPELLALPNAPGL